MKVYLPENLPVELFPENLKDEIFYFIHIISEERVLNKQYNTDSFINLNASKLKRIVGYPAIIDIKAILTDNNIIRCDNKYIPGEKSLGFKLTLPYHTAKLKIAELSNFELIFRINKQKASNACSIPNGVEYERLIQWLQSIEVDYKPCLEYINRNYAKNTHKWNCNIMAIDKLNDRNFFHVVDNAGGRFHTNITNLSRDLRFFLKYKGSNLVNIDIANSQPFLFNILVKNYYKKFNRPENIKCNNFNKLYIYDIPYDSYYDSYYDSNENKSYPDDVSLYLELTRNGEFYEYLIKEMNYLGERQAFKKEFFAKIFFSNNVSSFNIKERKCFKAIFPNVFKVIEYYQAISHNHLPIQLQKAERGIIINKVVKTIVTERPELFVNTIHDSILTTIGNEDFVREKMNEAFITEFGFQPKINFQYYSEDENPVESSLVQAHRQSI